MDIVLLNKQNAKVYPVPPATSADGHRANDWPDATKNVSVRVIGRGKDLTVQLLNKDSEKSLFVQCVIPNGEHEKWCERVVDSSRYWVMKVVNGQRHAFLGFGFSDRNDAFDFSCCLNDFKADRNRETEVQSVTQPLKDMSLKEGEKIQVNLPGLAERERRRPEPNVASAMGFGLLAPPPPPSGSSLAKPPAATTSLTSGAAAFAAPAQAAPVAEDFADFGDFADFQSAAAPAAPAAAPTGSRTTL